MKIAKPCAAAVAALVAVGAFASPAGAVPPSFQYHDSYEAPPYLSALAVVDLNGRGSRAVVVVGTSPGWMSPPNVPFVSVRPIEADGSLGPATVLHPGGLALGGLGLAVADFDG